VGFASVVQNPAWRRAPCATSLRVASSMLRRHVPGLREATVAFDGGRSRVIADLRTCLGLRLYRYGMRDPELDLVRLLLRPGDVFVDAGANAGLFSLVAAARVGPGGRVVACEPAPRMRAMVERNALLNGFGWVEAHGVALADQPGSAELVVFDGDGSGLSSFSPGSPEGGKRRIVPVTTLDELVPAHEAPRVAAVKIDVEGAEVRVLKGAARLLARCRPDLLVEVDEGHLARQGASARELRAIAEAAGYEAFRIGWDEAGDIELMPVAPGDDWARPPLSGSPNLFLTARDEAVRAAGVRVQGG
jgi:FkbM family methyltransferase